MGSGASFDVGDNDRCEGCGMRAALPSTQLCALCADPLVVNDEHFHRGEMSHTRLLSAVSVLRLIESQLQYELLLLQASLQNESCSNNGKHRRQTVINNLKVVSCSHINLVGKECAVCTDDLCVGEEGECVLLPCLHSFHSSCLSPWLLKKSTCPTCRLNLDLIDIPSIEDLDKFSRNDVIQKISYYVLISDNDERTKSELCSYLHSILVSRKKDYDMETETAMRSSSPDPTIVVRTDTTALIRPRRNSAMLSLGNVDVGTTSR